MSHVTTIKVEIKDLDALKVACKKVGLEFRENQKQYRWYGRHVGDYPVPAGFNISDLGKCHHAIGVPGNPNAYEIGVVQREGKHVLLWDFWAGGQGLAKIAGNNCENLVNAYTQEVALKEAKAFAEAEGWSIVTEWDAEASETVITLRKY